MLHCQTHWSTYEHFYERSPSSHTFWMVNQLYMTLNRTYTDYFQIKAWTCRITINQCKCQQLPIVHSEGKNYPSSFLDLHFFDSFMSQISNGTDIVLQTQRIFYSCVNWRYVMMDTSSIISVWSHVWPSVRLCTYPCRYTIGSHNSTLRGQYVVSYIYNNITVHAAMGVNLVVTIPNIPIVLDNVKCNDGV